MPPNLFQAQLDSVVSPLASRPAALGGAPTQANPTQVVQQAASKFLGPGLGGSLGGLLSGGQGKTQTDPLKPVLAALRTPVPPRAPGVAAVAPAPAAGGWVSAVAQQAKAAGVPPDLAVAIALEESGGNPRAVGDQGSSYGLYQLHKGGALGNLTPQQAYDPATNAGVVLRAWGRLGNIPSDPRAALMQYYSQVGRGSSNEIPTQNALGKLAEARRLLGQQGGAQTLAESTASSGRLSGQGLNALIGYAMELTKRAQQGIAPDPNDAFRLIGPIMQAFHQPTQEVLQGLAPGTDPGTGPRQPVVQAALSEIGVPYSWGGGGEAGPSRGIAQGANTVGFDCSSLIQYVWAKAGVHLPRTTYEQIKVGQSVPNLASAQAGDLLFPSTGHVMLYIGNGQAVESPHTGAAVRQVPVAGRQFMAIRRPG